MITAVTQVFVKFGFDKLIDRKQKKEVQRMGDLIQQGIAARKAGNRDEARKCFIAAIKQNQDNEYAWQFLYNVANDDKERILCLQQILRINPKNEKAQELLDQSKNTPVIKPPQSAPVDEAKQESPPQSKLIVNPTDGTSKKLDPQQQKNLQIGIVATITLCVVCMCLAVFNNNGGGGGNPTPTIPARQPPISLPTQQPPIVVPTYPYNTPAHPAGTTGLCVDGTYTSAANSQGACSRHGGISSWWGK